MTKFARAVFFVLALTWLGTACSDVCSGETEPSFFDQPELSNLHLSARRVSLSELCGEHDCPTRAEATREPIRVAGCGVESFQWRQGDLAGRQWNYDADTGKLIGAAFHDDVTSEVDGCEGASFQAGAGPPLGAGGDAGVTEPAPHRVSCDDVTVER
jgi:hypothetical protein